MTASTTSPRLDDADKALIFWLLATNQTETAIEQVLAAWGKPITTQQIGRYRRRHGDQIKQLTQHLHMKIPNGDLATSQQRFAKLQDVADDVEQRMDGAEDRDYANLLAKYLAIIKQIGDEVGYRPSGEDQAATRPRPQITLADMLAEGGEIDEETERDLFRALRRAEAAASAINGGSDEDQSEVEDGQ